jgi:hypothetical protein
MALMEESTNVAQLNTSESVFSQYEERYPKVYGKKL